MDDSHANHRCETISVTLANDTVPRYRTPSVAEIRELVRSQALPLTIALYRPIQSGEAHADPGKWIARFIADHPIAQMTIVQLGSELSVEQICGLQPAALWSSCSEVIEFVRCTYRDDMLMDIIVDEMSAFMPNMRKDDCA